MQWQAMRVEFYGAHVGGRMERKRRTKPGRRWSQGREDPFRNKVWVPGLAVARMS